MSWVGEVDLGLKRAIIFLEQKLHISEPQSDQSAGPKGSTEDWAGLSHLKTRIRTGFTVAVRSRRESRPYRQLRSRCQKEQCLDSATSFSGIFLLSLLRHKGTSW
jgi:hypothetical protein